MRSGEAHRCHPRTVRVDKSAALVCAALRKWKLELVQCESENTREEKTLSGSEALLAHLASNLSEVAAGNVSTLLPTSSMLCRK